MKERVLNEFGQFESCEAAKDRGVPIAELLILEKGKSATFKLELRDLKAKHDELVVEHMMLNKKYEKLVEKYEANATKVLADSLKSDPISVVKQDKKR